MKKLFFLFSLSMLTGIAAPAQDWVLARQFASTDLVEPIDSKVDASGNVYVVGNYQEALTITGLAPLTYSGSNRDIYLCKFSQTGTALWAKRIGGDLREDVGGLAIDASNNVYVIGSFKSTPVSFDGGTTTLWAENNYDAFLAKYDPSGTLVFADSIFWGTSVEKMTDITYDFTNNYLVIAGQFQTEIKYDSAGVVKTRTTTRPKDLILARFTTNGDFVDMVNYKASILESAFKNVNLSIINDAVTGYFVTGDLKGELRSPTDTEVLLSAPDVSFMDIMVLKYDLNLEYVWGRKGTGTNYDHINSSGSDRFGNIYFTGKTASNTFVIDSTATDPAAAKPSLGGFDYNFCKYNRNGNLQFIRREGGPGTDNAYGLAVRGERILYAGVVDIGGNQETGFAVYDDDGKQIARDTMFGDGIDIGFNVAFGLSGDSVYVVGNFTGDSLKAGDLKLTNTLAGVTDGFYVKYGYHFSVYESSRQNVLCYGGSTGSTTVKTEFGTEPITYAWTPNVSSTSTASGLTAGTYKIVATDAEGRKDSVEITLTQPPDITTSLVGSTPTSCNLLATSGNKSNGAVNISASGGVGTFDYTWSPSGQTTQDISNVTAGEHIVTVTDDNGCTEVDTFLVAEPAKVSHGGSVVDTIQIPPGSNGAVHLNTYGGTPGYTFSWTGPPGFIPSTEDTLKNLAYDGNYNLQVTDASSCVFDTAFNVPVDTGLSIVICGQRDVSCRDEEDGYAKVCVTLGGSGAYSYAWRKPSGTPVGLNDDELTIGAGTYIVKVTDLIKLIWSETSVVIAEPATPLTVGVDSVFDVSCFGLTDGKIYISVNGGWGGYSYLWTPTGKVTQDITGLAKNNYTVTISDTGSNSGTCVTQLTNISVGAPDQLTVTILDEQSISCAGSADGQLYADVGGGKRPYSYVWDDPGAQNDSIAKNLSANTYSVSVLDAKGCSAVDNHILGEPPALLIDSVTLTHPSMFGGSDGSVTVHASGGSPAYQYRLIGGVFQSDSVFSGLTAGTDTVVVTDSKGCGPLMAEFILVDPPELVFDSIVITDVNCNGDNSGNVCAYASGGVGMLSYQWTGGPGVQCYGGLTAGQYTVTVTDENMISIDSIISVSEPAAIMISRLYTTDISCNGGSDGATKVNASGGAGTLSFDWSSGESIDSIFGKISGDYTVTVTDDNGCTEQDIISIGEPAVLMIDSVSIIHPSMYGSSDGSVTVHSSGGNLAYQYSLIGRISQSDSVFSGLMAGADTVVVTDSKGCGPVMEEFTLVEPSGLVFDSIIITDINCNGDNTGNICAYASNGVGILTYQWTGGPATQCHGGLAGGSYTITVTDENMVSIDSIVSVSEPASGLAVANEEKTDILCYGSVDGTITISASGGTLPYSFTLNPGAIETNATGLFENLGEGTYSVSVDDANGCGPLSSSDLVIAEPDSISIDSLDVKDEIPGMSDGAIYIEASGGTGTLSYTLVEGSITNTTGLFENLVAGILSLIVTDDNNCTALQGAQIGTAETEIEIYDAFTPNGDGINEEWNIRNIGLYPGCMIRIYNTWGNLVFSSDGYEEPWDGTYNGRILPADTYFYVIDLGDGSDVLTGTVNIIK